MDLIITCPKCRTKIDVSEQITKLLDQRMERERTKLAKEERQKVGAQFKERVRKAAEGAANKAREEERAQREAEKRKFQSQLANRDKEVERLRKQQDQKVKAMAEKRIAQEVEMAKSDMDKSYREKLASKDLVIKEQQDKLSKAQKKAQELEAKVSQGSAQAQGILAEKDLFQFLKTHMPTDRCKVEKHGQGKKGTDVIIRVLRNDQRVGAVVIDDKWANEWGRDWPEKVWDDMQMHDANFAYIAAKPSALPQDIKTAGFGLAPCRRAGVRVWVIDRSNPHLILGILMDTVDKILKLAEIEDIYGATSKDMKQFQAYLTKNYEIDLREKAKHMSVAVKALNEIHKKVNSEYEKALEALKGYWTTEKRVHQEITARFSRDATKALPQIEFTKG